MTNLHFPINTVARFLWQDEDGAMRMGTGTTLDISRQSVSISAHSVPSPGTEVQVIVDMPALKGGLSAGRFMGKGLAVRVDHSDGRASGFAAEVRFQIVPANQIAAAATNAAVARKLSVAVRGNEERPNIPMDIDIAAALVAYGAVGEVNRQLQSAAA